MIPGWNIIGEKASLASVNGAGEQRGWRRGRVLWAGSKERLDWLNIDLNAAEWITVQDYKRTKN